MVAALIALAVLTLYCFGLFWTYRKRFYLATGRDQGYAIPTVKLDAFDERFRGGPFGPRFDAEIRFIGGAESVPAGTTDREAWILGVLAKDAHTIFEFGTATGKTAWLLACNAPPDAHVHTLTLRPDQAHLYRHEHGDRGIARDTAIEESAFDDFFYCGSDVESKVTQHYGDSKALDTSPWRGRCDLIFVDGAHAYSYVVNDSRKAFEMLSPRGIILWHDYKRRSGTPLDVVRALDELARERRLVRLAGTHMVAYRAEWGSGARTSTTP
jgi:predicted O-methyltransferase YrrM